MKRYLAKRVAVTLLVVLVVVGAAAALPMLSGPPETTETNYPEYDPSALMSEPVSATGEIEPDRSAAEGDVVVFDASHLNRYDREDIAPMVRAFVRAGYEVEFHEEGALREGLEGADAFVVIDPAQSYSSAEAETIRRFTGAGGRVLVLAEPNRITVSGALGGLRTTRSQIGAIEGKYDVQSGTGYVYDMEENSGNYKHVVASPTEGSDIEGVEDVTLYTAAEVRTPGSAEAVLETAPSAQTAGNEQQRRHTVAAVDGNLMLVGDSTLTRSDRYNVGDNNEFLAYVIEFLIAGDGSAFEAVPGSDSDSGADDETESGTETATTASAPEPA